MFLDSAGDDHPERQSVVLLECANNTVDKFPHQSFIVTLVKSIDDNDQVLLCWKEGNCKGNIIARRTNWFDNQFLELVRRRFSGDVSIGINGILN